MKTKRYQDMSAQELAEATREFDKEWTGKTPPGRALTRKERAEFEAGQKERLRAKPHTPAPARLELTIPSALVEQVDALAKRKRTTRGRLIQRLVEQALHQAVA
jgi:hypothetical protein